MTPQPDLSFFTRNDLVESDRDVCDKAAQELYPICHVRPSLFQGYCSYTLLLSPSGSSNGSNANAIPTKILQFRPMRYSLNFRISAAAKAAYEDYAPATVLKASIALPGPSSGPRDDPRELLLYEIEKIPGIPYSSCCIRQPDLNQEARARQERLIKDFAGFIARAWPKIQDIYPGDKGNCNGKVGSTIRERLQKLAHELPAGRLRSHAQKALDDHHRLQDLPVVLTHGDVVPSNIMVDPDSGRLRGLVDWAEAEYLPFGMCLYGLEHLLGYMPVKPPKGLRYYTCAAELRLVFWNEIYERIPALHGNTRLQSVTELSRDVGVLLWHGFAWDDGAIARVITPDEDAEELMFLQACLDPGKASSLTL